MLEFLLHHLGKMAVFFTDGNGISDTLVSGGEFSSSCLDLKKKKRKKEKSHHAMCLYVFHFYLSLELQIVPWLNFSLAQSEKLHCRQ